MRAVFQLVGLVAFSTCLAMDFTPPKTQEILHAIGRTEGLPMSLQRALDPGDAFVPLPVPKPGDWLDVHPEAGQSFEEFLRAQRNQPDRVRNKIYLQPLGEFPEAQSPPLEALKQFTAAYFTLDVKILPTLNTGHAKLTTRINPLSRNLQILTSDVLMFLNGRLPTDAFCLLAITMEDLYPHPSWNFVFGQASLQDRVGVFSFARYDPAFYGQEREDDYQELLLRRSCKVLAHEIGHMFSMRHCIYFHCLMNGSNHLKESDARPLTLCPVCLRKLHSSIGFDIVDRYRKLLYFYRKVGFDHEARWVSNRCKRIVGDEKGR
jgi:archaemetzincin